MLPYQKHKSYQIWPFRWKCSLNFPGCAYVYMNLFSYFGVWNSSLEFLNTFKFTLYNVENVKLAYVHLACPANPHADCTQHRLLAFKCNAHKFNLVKLRSSRTAQHVYPFRALRLNLGQRPVAVTDIFHGITRIMFSSHNSGILA
jgi:hypothetical protein